MHIIVIYFHRGCPDLIKNTFVRRRREKGHSNSADAAPSAITTILEDDKIPSACFGPIGDNSEKVLAQKRAKEARNGCRREGSSAPAHHESPQRGVPLRTGGLHTSFVPVVTLVRRMTTRY